MKYKFGDNIQYKAEDVMKKGIVACSVLDDVWKVKVIIYNPHLENQIEVITVPETDVVIDENKQKMFSEEDLQNKLYEFQENRHKLIKQNSIALLEQKIEELLHDRYISLSDIQDIYNQTNPFEQHESNSI